MESSPGLCRNTQSCALARSGEPIAIPLYDPFVCPACGAALVPPALPAAANRKLLPICLAGAMVCAIVASAAVWRLGAHRTNTAVLESVAIPAGPATIALAGLMTPPPLSVDAEPEAPGVAPAAMQPDPAIGPAVTQTGMRIVCGAAPDGGSQGCTARAHRQAMAARHARTRRSTQLAASPPPAPIRQPSSTLAVSSLPPTFPDQFYESDWMSTVTVDCMIAADGKPSGCREKRREGSARFADAILDWLGNPRTRFQPATRQGQDVAARRIWQIGFTP